MPGMTEQQIHGPDLTSSNRAKQILLNDHAAVERLLAQLSTVVAGDDPSGVCELWTRFERFMRAHLEFEEQRLFPLIPLAHLEELDGLRAEHQRIRCALGELGIAADLHTLRKASVDELIGYLQQHAAREERSFYGWLDDQATARHGLRALFDRHTENAPWPLDE